MYTLIYWSMVHFTKYAAQSIFSSTQSVPKLTDVLPCASRTRMYTEEAHSRLTNKILNITLLRFHVRFCVRHLLWYVLYVIYVNAVGTAGFNS